MTKAIILMRIKKDGAISDEEMETVLVSHPDSSAASECIGEEEEESNFVINKLRVAKKEDTFLNSLHHEFENYPLKFETPLFLFRDQFSVIFVLPKMQQHQFTHNFITGLIQKLDFYPITRLSNKRCEHLLLKKLNMVAHMTFWGKINFP